MHIILLVIVVWLVITLPASVALGTAIRGPRAVDHKRVYRRWPL